MPYRAGADRRARSRDVSRSLEPAWGAHCHIPQRCGKARTLQLGEAALQISALDAIRHQCERSPIGISRSFERTEPAQQIGAGSVKEVIALEFTRAAELVDELEPASRSLTHSDGDGAVQQHHWAWIDPGQHVIEGGNLLPVR